MTGDVDVRPVGEVPWADVAAVFGTRGDPARCWCQWFKLNGGEWRGTGREQCRDSLRTQAEAAPGPGLVAYLDGEPVGWCAVEPRTAYERLRAARVTGASEEPFEDETVWAITCLVVRVGFRKRGVASGLVIAAVEHARRNGARVVEAYPVDTVEKPGRSAADLYHGTVSLFTSAGLSVTARPLPGRALMSVTLR